MSLIETRRHQMFPVLDAVQIETARRFASGAARDFAPGEIVFEVGDRHAPTWLVLKGAIDITRRDGLDHMAPITSEGVGQFTGEVSQLAGRGSLASGPRLGRGLHRAAVRCRAYARAGHRLGRARRDRHARLHPAPRRADRDGRRGLGAGRPAGRGGSRARCRASSRATAIPTSCSTPPMTAPAAPLSSGSACCRRSCR